MISISKVIIDEIEQKTITSVLKTGKLTQGKKVEEFESAFANYIGTKYAIAVSSGTSALYLSLLSLGIGKGDEVITTPFSFIASSNAILYTGAKPVFADIEKESFNIDPELITKKITSKTKAILPVHLYGLPCNIKKIQIIAKKYKLKIIEDSCQAHGAEYLGKKVGSIGELGCFSFYATKNMTTIEGGMITTNSRKLYESIKLLRNHGSKKRYHHSILGFNFRMTEINAVLGIEQLKKLDRFNNARIKNANFFNNNLSDLKEIILPNTPKEYRHVFHQYTIKLRNPKTRGSLINYLNKKGISSQIYYPIPIHKQKEYLDLGFNDKCPITEKICKQVLSIPVHPYLSKNDLNKIADSIKSFFVI
jgi:perosamine synthetase